jgi:hypothetical protein
MPAVAAGRTTPMGWPAWPGPGQLPAISSACALTSSRTAAWICGTCFPRCGAGSVSVSDQRPLASVNGTGPRAVRVAVLITCWSVRALAAPICPLTRIVVEDEPASRLCAAAGSARVPKLASAVVTVTEVSTASRRLAGTSGANRVLRSTNDARDPGTLPRRPARVVMR